MSHFLELSRSSPFPNIVTTLILKCGPIHGSFLSTHIWDLILTGNFYASPIYHTPAQGFIPLLTTLLDPYHIPKSETHPTLPAKGFASFQAVLRFINGCKWLLMLVCHPTYYYSTIAFQGLYFLEDQMTASNMAARWKEPTIQNAPASYQVMEIMHNLFATLRATARNIPQSRTPLL